MSERTDKTGLALACVGALLFVVLFFLAADGSLHRLAMPLVGLPFTLALLFVLLVTPIRLVIRAQRDDDDRRGRP